METAKLKAWRKREVEDSAISSLQREGRKQSSHETGLFAECGVAVYVYKGAGVTQCDRV